MVPIFNDGIWKLEALSEGIFQMIRTQDTVFMDTSFIFVVFQWRGKVKALTGIRQPLQVQSHLEMPGILVQLGHIQRT